MSLRTTAEIQTDLTAARTALSNALNGNYSVNTGQGSQSVQRPSLKDLRALIRALEAELAEAEDPQGGVVAARMRRY